MEDLDLTGEGFWAGRRVLVTGHTGFKGAWLLLWLQGLGACVRGLALAAEDSTGMYLAAGPWPEVDEIPVDLRQGDAVRKRVEEAAPEVVMHLGAQALIRQGYADPVGTYATNVLGTVHVLDACVGLPDLQAVVIVTSDKVYANTGRLNPFREEDELGGDDPYSASKACVELVAAAWARALGNGRPALATARAGNVIGGGDRAADRLLPDVLRALELGQPIRLRYPTAVRPWQHVLEPLAGYLLLAQRLVEAPKMTPPSVNFGPFPDACRPVVDIVEIALAEAGQGRWESESTPQPPERQTLTLDSSLANSALGWRPRLSLEEAVRWTIEWWAAQRGAEDVRALSRRQIAAYVTRVRS